MSYLFNLIIRIAAAIISGILLSAAFPAYHFSFLAWIALVPFFVVITRCRPVTAFCIALIFGFFFFTGVFYWIFDLPKYTMLHHMILGVYLCPMTGLLALIISFIAKRHSALLAFMTAPFLWVIYEYIRSTLSFLSLPWGLLAHTQYLNPPIIQIASLTGVSGVSFLIVLVNSALACLIHLGIDRLKPSVSITGRRVSPKEALTLVASTAAVALIVLIYGYTMISRPITGQRVKVALVQGNIDQSRKWDPKYAKKIMRTYADLTNKASFDKPDLIVWPETATPRSISIDQRLYNRIQTITKTAGTPLLIGSAQVAKFKVNDPKSSRYFNSAHLILPQSGKKGAQRYDKVRLLPFGEYLPYKETIPWSYIHVPEVDHYLPGKEFTIFDLNDYRFGVTVCWENIFSQIVRQFVKGGAQFIINLTNEAWFGESAAPYQFLSMSVFRAVENKIFIVRCTNTGISCFIDPCGRIVERLEDESGKDIFIRGILKGSVVPLENKTLYMQFGDWFVWLNILGLLFILFVSLLKKRQLNSR